LKVTHLKYSKQPFR